MTKPRILHHSDGDYVPKSAYDELKRKYDYFESLFKAENAEHFDLALKYDKLKSAALKLVEALEKIDTDRIVMPNGDVAHKIRTWTSEYAKEALAEWRKGMGE